MNTSDNRHPRLDADSQRNAGTGQALKLAPSVRNLACLAVLVGIPLSFGAAHGQAGNPLKDLSEIRTQQNPEFDRNKNLEDPAKPKITQKQLEQINVLRQKEMAADSEKLLALATELKADVDKTSKDTLSLEVVRKADQIEKLAKSVKQKMKASIGG